MPPGSCAWTKGFARFLLTVGFWLISTALLGSKKSKKVSNLFSNMTAKDGKRASCKDTRFCPISGTRCPGLPLLHCTSCSGASPLTFHLPLPWIRETAVWIAFGLLSPTASNCLVCLKCSGSIGCRAAVESLLEMAGLGVSKMTLVSRCSKLSNHKKIYEFHTVTEKIEVWFMPHSLWTQFHSYLVVLAYIWQVHIIFSPKKLLSVDRNCLNMIKTIY